MELEQQRVGSVAARVAGSGAVLRRYHIDVCAGHTLAAVAAGVSASTDELLALAQERQLRAARRIAALKQHPEWEWMRGETLKR